MGLDQEIIRTTKKRLAAIQDYNSKLEILHNWESELYNRPDVKSLIENLPKSGCQYDYDKYTEQQNDEIERLNNLYLDKAKEIGISIRNDSVYFDEARYGLGEDDTTYLIEDFRKEWPLHQFIVDNFWDASKDDNLIEIPLQKESLEKLIEHGFFPDVFRNALSMIDDTHCIYYWAWY